MKSTSTIQSLEFKVFEGPNNREMPNLIAASLVPASVADIMRGRLEGKLSWDVYYDSGDEVRSRRTDGERKLVYDSQALRNLTPQSELCNGALVLSDDAWDAVEGRVLLAEEIAKYTGRSLSRDEVMGNPIWRWHVHDDMELLRAYAGEMFPRVKTNYRRDTAMGIYLPDDSGLSVSVGRLWCLGGAGIYYSGDAGGDFHIGYDYIGRLVGVPETSRVSGPGNRGFPVGAPEAPSQAKGVRERAAPQSIALAELSTSSSLEGEKDASRVFNPSLEDVLDVVNPYVLERLRPELSAELQKKLYK